MLLAPVTEPTTHHEAGTNPWDNAPGEEGAAGEAAAGAVAVAGLGDGEELPRPPRMLLKGLPARRQGPY